MGCGRPVILFFFSFFCLLFPHAKPFIALGDVKSAGCLQQCHETKGLPTEAARDTMEPGPLPSPCPLAPDSAYPHPKPGIRAFFFFFQCFWLRGLKYQSGFLFVERAIVWCCVFLRLSDLLALEPQQQHRFVHGDPGKEPPPPPLIRPSSALTLLRYLRQIAQLHRTSLF